MKTRIISLVSLAVAAALGTWMLQAQLHNRPFAGLPYGVTFDMAQTQTYQGTTNAKANYVTYAYKKDGTWAVVARKMDERLGVVASGTVMDLSNGGAIRTVHHLLGVKSSYPMTTSRLEHQKNELTWCRHADHLDKEYGFVGYGLWRGYNVALTVVEPLAMPDGTLTPRLEKWFATDLACAMVKEIATWGDGSIHPGLVTVKEAENIVVGDPDETLFGFENYDELSPGQVELRAQLLFGRDFGRSSCVDDDQQCRDVQLTMQQNLLQQEKVYWDAQQRRLQPL